MDGEGGSGTVRGVMHRRSIIGYTKFAVKVMSTDIFFGLAAVIIFFSVWFLAYREWDFRGFMLGWIPSAIIVVVLGVLFFGVLRFFGN